MPVNKMATEPKHQADDDSDDDDDESDNDGRFFFFSIIPRTRELELIDP